MCCAVPLPLLDRPAVAPVGRPGEAGLQGPDKSTHLAAAYGSHTFLHHGAVGAADGVAAGDDHTTPRNTGRETWPVPVDVVAAAMSENRVRSAGVGAAVVGVVGVAGTAVVAAPVREWRVEEGWWNWGYVGTWLRADWY